MKKKWYRSGIIKGLAMLLSYILLVAAVFGGVIMMHMGKAGINLESGEEFSGSHKFRNLVFDYGAGITNGLKAEIIHEAMGSTDSPSYVDVGAFEQEEHLTNLVTSSNEENSGLLYSVEEMEAWAKTEENWELNGYDMPLLKCVKEDGTYHYFYYKEFVQGLTEGTISCELTENCRSYFDEADDGGYLGNHSKDEIRMFLVQAAFNSDKIGKVRVRENGEEQEYVSCTAYGDYPAYLLNPTTEIGERYSPKGYDNLLDFLNKNEEWNSKLDLAYNRIVASLNEMESFVGGSYGNISAYEAGKTNVTYLYADLDQNKIYTNEAAYEDYRSLEKSLKEMEKQSYVQIRSDKESVTNVDKMEEANILNALEYHAAEVSDAENYVFALQIDTDYPVADEFAAANEEYTRYAGKLEPLLILEGICVVLWLVLVLWLTLVAGRKPEDEEIHLNWFDHIYTEVAALLVGGIWLAGFVLGINLNFPMEENLKVMFGWSALAAVFTQTFFLTGWLSLARRVKAKTIWKNSLCRVLCRWIYIVWKKIKKWLKKGIDGIKAMIYGKDILLNGLKRISEGEIHYKIPLDKVLGKRKVMAEYINNIGDGLDAAVEKAMRSERMKTDLITNVSHDIKTPLTSIINYVDLLKRENFTDPKIQGYLKILDEKSQRLKILTEDVVEASKASSGNINLELTDLDFVELLQQVLGEFQEKFQEKNLAMLVHFEEESSIIRADGQRMWRVLSNIFSNVVKYAMEGTRVYAEVQNKEKKVIFTLKNISSQPLNISADELTERFIRGDVSRNTEGSGLGLSIAKSLTELQGGEFKLFVDGDLFKVMITFVAK